MSNDTKKNPNLKIANTTFNLEVIAQLMASKDGFTKEKFVEMHKPKLKEDPKTKKMVPDNSMPSFAGDINAAWDTIQNEIKVRGFGAAKPVTA